MRKADNFANLFIGIMLMNTVLFLYIAVAMTYKFNELSTSIDNIEVKPHFEVNELYIEQKDSTYLITKLISDTL